MRDNMREHRERRMSKVEHGVTRHESTTVGNENYDVIFLENFLTDHPDLFPVTELSLSDSRLQDAVSEGNTYWGTKSGEKLGPFDFLKLWEEQSTKDESLTVDLFLENLKITHPDWIEHIRSIQFADNNLSRPIWLYADANHHPYPFDGMHRLTRAFLNRNQSIKVIEWKSIPDEAKLETKI